MNLDTIIKSIMDGRLDANPTGGFFYIRYPWAVELEKIEKWIEQSRYAKLIDSVEHASMPFSVWFNDICICVKNLGEEFPLTDFLQDFWSFEAYSEIAMECAVTWPYLKELLSMHTSTFGGTTISFRDKLPENFVDRFFPTGTTVEESGEKEIFLDELILPEKRDFLDRLNDAIEIDTIYTYLNLSIEFNTSGVSKALEDKRPVGPVVMVLYYHTNYEYSRKIFQGETVWHVLGDLLDFFEDVVDLFLDLKESSFTTIRIIIQLLSSENHFSKELSLAEFQLLEGFVNKMKDTWMAFDMRRRSTYLLADLDVKISKANFDPESNEKNGS